MSRREFWAGIGVIALMFGVLVVWVLWTAMVTWPAQDAECRERGGVPERGRSIFLCLDPDSLR